MQPQGDSGIALRQWEAANNVDTTTDAHYHVDTAKMKQLDKEKPWKQDPKYFTSVRISALALVKIIMHAKTGQNKKGFISEDQGNWIEVMGYLQGFYSDHTFVITDSFALPVEGNEVSVSLSEQAQMYVVSYMGQVEHLNRKDACVGFYHSHPGYTCFLSGIDVNTQTLNQAHQDPWIALVVDPVRTITTGKVEIKAFRTYPERYVPVDDVEYGDEAIPQKRIEELGVYMHRYYEVPMTVFRSSADAQQLNALWNKYWMKTLSTSPLVVNRYFMDQQLKQVTQKLEEADRAVGTKNLQDFVRPQSNKTKKKNPIAATSRLTTAVCNDVLQGFLGMVVKRDIFNGNASTPDRTQ